MLGAFIAGTALAFTGATSTALAQTLPITYQGRLTADASGANGPHDFELRLYGVESGGSVLGGPFTYTGVPVENGLFTLNVNVTTATLTNKTLYLEILVRASGGGAYTLLSPRQPLTAAPFARFADRLHLPVYLTGAPANPSEWVLGVQSTGGGSALLGNSSTWGVTGAGGTGVGFTWFPVAVPCGVQGLGAAVGVGGSSDSGIGVQALSRSGTALSARSGTGNAIEAEATSTIGVRSRVTSGTGVDSEAVTGSAGVFARTSPDGNTPALSVTNAANLVPQAYALSATLTSNSQGVLSAAVRGTNNGTSGTGVGVWGSHAGAGFGVYGTSSGAGYGVVGVSNGLNGAAIAGQGNNGALAGQFFGNVTVGGNLTVTGSVAKGSGTFAIDHPLDPENKTLSHAFVESPEMKNIYDGVATLDGDGRAVVTMPAWFSALNTDFRYQLTCVGGYAPVYIEREIERNTFVIAGGREGLRVSWQITGVRQDAYARQNPVAVEAEKPEHLRGRYLHPEAFGAPTERGIHARTGVQQQ
jgi:hypothetical protein